MKLIDLECIKARLYFFSKAPSYVNIAVQCHDDPRFASPVRRYSIWVVDDYNGWSGMYSCGHGEFFGMCNKVLETIRTKNVNSSN